MTVREAEDPERDRRLEAIALVAAQRALDGAGGLPGLPRDLQDLCRAATRNLGATGAVVNLMTGDGPDCVVAAADDLSRQVGELPFAVGEGPCFDAFTDGRPVLVTDLAATAGRQWPGYASSASALGVGAVFCAPLHVGAVRLGVLEVYHAGPKPWDREEMAMLLTFAGVGTEMLLHGTATEPDDDLEVRLRVVLDQRAEIHQAQGMVMVDLGVGLAAALVRMRAHAFSRDLALIDVARSILGGYVLPVDGS